MCVNLRLPAATFGLDSGYPAAPTGPFSVRFEDGVITADNSALTFCWKLTPQGLRPSYVRDEASGRKLSLSNEIFEIVLTNGRRYAASSLILENGPAIGDLAANAQASRLADRIPGRKVEVSLRSADQCLRVIWQALATDGANYVRQTVAVTPLQEDCPIRETIWFHEGIADARTAGQVDGSPVVAGPFFLGLEDPHASNTAQGPDRPIATWTPADLVYGQTRNKTWSLEPALLLPGTNEFIFQYEAGPHRLDIWRAVLLENGRDVARDAHHGHTGTANALNCYSLSLPRVNPSARYEVLAELSTDPDFVLPPGGRVESQGRIFLRGREGPTACRLTRGSALRKGETLTQSFVLGVAPAGQMRRAFLYYLERERAHPYRPYLHYNSWYDTAWEPFALNETNCLEAIRLCGEQFIRRHEVTMDGMVFDDGWDNPQTLWQFHRGFPNGFTPLAELCRHYQTRLGVWLSPFGGYGEPRNQRLKFGSRQGYETNATGFSLAGPKYCAAFKQACLNMIRNYGVNHFKFDGIAAGMYASGGADYLRDTEAMRRLMLELRAEAPDLFINLTTGSWPSPFWLRYADSVWRQGGDMGLAGKGVKQQQWLTYRDQETRRNIVGKGPLFPLNALMTQGVAYSRHGLAGDPTFTSQGFKDDVRAFFGGGTCLQELYIQPGKLTGQDWAVLAEAAKWSRANADVLVDTHWVGGDPGRLEVYGYASWAPRKGILMLRNPDDRAQTFALEVGAVFELPAGAPTSYELRSPWAEDAGQRALKAEAGKPITIPLKPFEVIIFEAAPTTHTQAGVDATPRAPALLPKPLKLEAKEGVSDSQNTGR